MPVEYKNASVGDIIKAVADYYHADVLLCEATAWVESGFNVKAVGDNGTSFSLYQLHKGGELGNLTPAEAEDPIRNCSIAIATIAAVEKAHPTLSPGAVAAMAQRPANQDAYATAVNAVYNAVKAGKPPAGYLMKRNAATGYSVTDPWDGKTYN